MNVRFSRWQVTIFIGVCIALFSLYSSYRIYHMYQTKAHKEYRTTQRLVEERVASEVWQAHTLKRILAVQLEMEMARYSHALIELHGGNPHVEFWDLSLLQEEPVHWLINVFDEELNVVASTHDHYGGAQVFFHDDLRPLLQEWRLGSTFVVGDTDFSYYTGWGMKYSYMPTPDHQYLIQLGIDIQEYYPSLREMRTLSSIEKLEQESGILNSVTLYRFDTLGDHIIRFDERSPRGHELEDHDALLGLQR